MIIIIISSLSKILGAFFRMNKVGTQSTGPKEKKIDDYAQGLTSKR